MIEENEQEGNKKDFKFDMEAWRKRRYTYDWHFYNEKYDDYFEYTEDFLYQEGAIMEGEERVECIEVPLYKSPEKPPYDFYIQHGNWQLAMLVEFFKEVFEERAFEEGYQPSHKYFSIVLPQEIHHQILNVINDFGLLPIRDLILETVATAQGMYAKDIARWERPYYKKLIDTVEKQTDDAIKVIEWSGLDSKHRIPFDEKFRPELDHIKFVFNPGGTIKIDHGWLKQEFIEHMMRYYDDMHYKDWKKDLARYPQRFQENVKKSKFKYRLANSYYNLLSKAKFFEVTEEVPYPNKLMLCIAKLIEFSLIPVGDWADPDDVKVKHIRNWLRRNDLEPKLTFAEVPADLEKLKKYFEPNFLEMANATKRADAISVAFFICHRFDIQDLLPDVIHLASCIKETNWLVGHQMTSNSRMNEPDIPEMNAFRQLMNGVKDKKKLTSIKFTMEGEEGEQELSSRLPLYLIEEALKEYYQNDQIEFDADAIPTTYKKNEDSSIKIEKAPQFNLPHERHLVRLVHALYNFLKDHSGIEEGKIIPGQQYYEIIGTLFKETWVFYNKMVDDRSVVEKIKQWHKLSLES